MITSTLNIQTMKKTKNILFRFSMLVMAWSLFSCDINDEQVTPSSSITTQSVSFDNYEAIEASHAFQVFMTFSDTDEIIEIEANDNLHQYIELDKINSRLRIGLKDHISVRGSATLKAYITTRYVDTYAASGASKIELRSTLDAQSTYIDVSGASSFSGGIHSTDVMADISGASSMHLSGTSSNLNIDVSGASNFRHYSFEVQNLHAELSGASSAWLTVNSEIEVDASGASTLKYRGGGTVVAHNISGASTVIKVD
jgi:hypothetical protein